MKRLLVAAAAAVGLLGLFSGPALAQDPALAVVPTQACGRVTLTVTAATGVYTVAVYSGPNAGGQVESLGTIDSSADGATRTFTLDEDSYGGRGFVSWATVAGPEQDNWVHGAVAVDTDCSDDPPATSTSPAPPSSEDPAPPASTAPAAPPAAARDLDCADYPRPDGTTAQQALDTDRSDPFLLDADHDGIPCEADEPENTADPTGGQIARVPAGSVDTGSW